MKLQTSFRFQNKYLTSKIQYVSIFYKSIMDKRDKILTLFETKRHFGGFYNWPIIEMKIYSVGTFSSLKQKYQIFLFLNFIVYRFLRNKLLFLICNDKLLEHSSLHTPYVCVFWLLQTTTQRCIKVYICIYINLLILDLIYFNIIL